MMIIHDKEITDNNSITIIITTKEIKITKMIINDKLKKDMVTIQVRFRIQQFKDPWFVTFVLIIGNNVYVAGIPRRATAEDL